MKGVIVRSTGSSYYVRLDDGTVVDCHVKGNFRIRGIRSTNPVAVGDRVSVGRQPDGTNWIMEIDDRKNYIIRRSTNLSKQSHIIAANLDMAALVVTVNHPVTSLVFIDRFLATAEAYRVPACLIFNKIDLLTGDELSCLDSWKALYAGLGYPVFAVSAKHLGEDADALAQLLGFFAHKVVLLSGNSGVGKSTLLNVILGEERARTAAISVVHNKGMHTTTFSEMYSLPASGWIIDTPGIKGFGVLDMQKEEISHYFKEIFRIGQDCRFSNCTHTGEPGCCVLKAVETGIIAPSRFESYLSILGDSEEEKYR